MKPIKFKEVNVKIAEKQKQYLTLPAFKKENVEGETIICWKLNLFERLWLLLTGKCGCLYIHLINRYNRCFLVSLKERYSGDNKNE